MEMKKKDQVLNEERNQRMRLETVLQGQKEGMIGYVYRG